MLGVDRICWLLHTWDGTGTERCKPLSAVQGVGQTIFHNADLDRLQGVPISQSVLNFINNLHFQIQFHFTALESVLVICLLWQVKAPDAVYPYKSYFVLQFLYEKTEGYKVLLVSLEGLTLFCACSSFPLALNSDSFMP